MDPPVSLPSARGASNAATAAAEPPPDPPGIRSRSQGLRVGPYAECSVEEPIANSSMLVLPIGTRPAARALATTVASYGDMYPSRIRDPDVDGMSVVTRTSFTASGTPASSGRLSPAARRASMAAARSVAASLTWRKACTSPSTAWIRSRCARVASTLETSPSASSVASSAAGSRVSSLITAPPRGSRSRESGRHRRPARSGAPARS